MPKAVKVEWPGRSSQTWTHDGAEWAVEVIWSEIEGFVECTGLQVRSVDERRVLRASTLRSLPLGAIVRDARRARFEDEAGKWYDAMEQLDKPVPDFVHQSAKAWSRPKRRAQLTSEHYEHVAGVYAGALQRGTAPRLAVMERWTVSGPTASRWIAQARSRGLLPPTTPGKARAVTPAPEKEEDQ